MKPLLVLQNLHADGPAYLGTWLRREGVPHRVVNAEAGEPFPASIDGYGALAVLGGEMGANDPLPALRQAESLILQAMQAGRPVIGHCLGGQLMARALGARVAVAPVPEIGWQPITIDRAEPLAARWFGERPGAIVMQWHYDAFALPRGARPLAASAVCAHQAFAIGDRHLAMQFHVEVDAEKLTRWSQDDGPRYATALQLHPGTVQSGAAMREAGGRHLIEQQSLADVIYRRWLECAVAS